MQLAKATSLSLPFLLLAACASHQKPLKPSTEIVDAAPAAPAPAPAVAAAPAPGTCSSDAACGPGEVCTNGRCTAAACSVSKVTFGFDSSQLDPAALDALRADAQCIQQRRAQSLLIEGHCDERGTAAYNLALGARRAEAVKKYLAGLGVSAPIETVSFGKELPAVQGTGESVWAQNRRAELRLPGDARSDGKVVSR